VQQQKTAVQQQKGSAAAENGRAKQECHYERRMVIEQIEGGGVGP